MNKDTPILITGAAGLAGYWLTQELKQRGFDNLILTDIKKHEYSHKIITGPITDTQFLHKLLDQYKPSLIFHLAGIVGNHQPELLDSVNVRGTEILFKNLIELNLKNTKVVLVSSSSVYGDHGEKMITEDMEPYPTSPYSISKMKQENIAMDYFNNYSLPIIISRTFNNFAPREKAHMFVSRIATQIVEIELKKKAKLSIGPMFSYRDYLDTRDAVNAYIDLGIKGIPGEKYNVCSGKAVQIIELFNYLLSCSKTKIPYEVINYDQRGNIPFQVGSPEKLHRLSGWKTLFNIKNTLKEIMDYWRSNLQS